MKANASNQQVDVVVDCFGLMHARDQRAALAERAGRLAPGGVLLLQYHALSTILARGQWNALRHGHFAYYSATALTAMLSQVGLRTRTAWRFDLYGGTILLAATRAGDGEPDGPGDETVLAVLALLAEDARVGVGEPGTFAGLQSEVRDHARAVHDWLATQRAAGTPVLGYGPRPARSRCCARRTWITPFCLWLSTLPRPSRASGCPEPTSQRPPGRAERARAGRGATVRAGPDDRGPYGLS